jgi:hypothetical protein
LNPEDRRVQLLLLCNPTLLLRVEVTVDRQGKSSSLAMPVVVVVAAVEELRWQQVDDRNSDSPATKDEVDCDVWTVDRWHSTSSRPF